MVVATTNFCISSGYLNSRVLKGWTLFKVPLRFCSVFEKQGNSLEPAIYNLYLLKPISTPSNSEAAASLHPNATDQGTPQRGPILSAICETIPGQSQKASTVGYHTILYHDTSRDTESPCSATPQHKALSPYCSQATSRSVSP